MEYQKDYFSQNRILYFVSDVYSVTKRFPAGEPELISKKIRGAAVSVSAVLNLIPEVGSLKDDRQVLYSVLSSMAVLETYLLMSEKFCTYRDIREMDEKLQEVKKLVNTLLDR